MNRMLLFLVLLPFGVISQNKISYNVYYDEQLGNNGLKVEVNFTAKKATDSTVFHYSNQVWGQDSLFKSLLLPESENSSVSFQTNPEKDELIVYHPKGKKIQFTYRIKQDYKEPDYYIVSRPRVNDTFFYVLGQSLFMVPKVFTESTDEPAITATINWVGFPEDYKIHNMYASQQKKQVIKDNLWNGFYNVLYVGGDYRIYNFSVKEKPVYFAVRGSWLNGYTDEFLSSNLEKAILSQREFWNDYNQPYFTFILSPTVTQVDSLFRGSSITGSSVRNGFMMMATNNPFNSQGSYKYILFHELMHDWIGQRIRNKHEELNYWFSEGFTDYYTYKNRLRAKDISYDEWLSSFNKEVIEQHWKNPERNIPNYSIKDDFWKSRNVEKVPYRRGAVFAFWLDNQILLKSNYTQSLDDLMRELLKKCVAENVLLTDELFLGLTEKYLNEDISYFFQKHILNGEDMDLLKEKWIEGFQFQLKDEIPQLQLINNNEEKYLVR
ncbi:MAG: peptidase [Crocinitomicaceae bacterium]|nr:peptidase [Crocinitomicaceae bacterium]